MGKYRGIKIALKVFFWTLFSLLSLIIIILAAVVWILSPSQLTPLAEKYANEYLDADVKIGRAELTIWKTFPYATIDIDDLTIVSNAFKSLSHAQRATLPEYADTLIDIRSFHIGINLVKISLLKFELQDIMLNQPRINLVAYSPTIANYNIVPPSPTDDEPFTLPNISINSIEINNCRGINYFSAPDSMEVNLRIAAIQLATTNNTNFQLFFNGSTSVAMANQPVLTDFPFKINGIIDWNYSNPLEFALSNWKMTLLDFPVDCNLKMSLNEKPAINKFDIAIGPVSLTSILPLIPEKQAKYFNGIKTDINTSIKLALTKTYILNEFGLPSLNLDILIPKSYIKFPKGERIDRFAIDAKVKLNGSALDSSIITLNNLEVGGRSIDFNIKGKVSNLISNPHIVGTFKGKADIEKVIRTFKIPLQYSIQGSLVADTKVDARLKDMNKNSFYKMNIDGNIKLLNFNFFDPKDSISIYTGIANMKFGVNNSVVTNDTKINDITMAEATIDTLSLTIPGIKMYLKNGLISAGAVCNSSNMLDSTKIVPLGGTIKAERIKIIDDSDSSIINFRNLACNTTIKRFQDNTSLPLIGLDISASRASYGNKTSRMNLRDGIIKLETNPRIRNNTKLNLRIDSLSRIYPTLSRDSIAILARKRRTTPEKKEEGEVADLSVDSTFKNLLQKWQVKGSIQAKRGRVFTPFFPLRNTLSDIDVLFSVDSVIVNHAHYKTGQSMFDITGGIRNIRTTLMGRNRKPLSVNFTIDSDTLDVNELIKAAFAGAAYADKSVDERYKLGDGYSDSDFDMLSQDVDENTDTTLTAIIIPRNIDADIDIRTCYAVYADMILDDASGCIQIHDGALNLGDIMAKSNMGDIQFNALYAAPDKKHIKFAFDLGMKDIQIKRFINMIPAIDSIMPLLRSMDGIIHADIAATTDVDSSMNIIMPSLKAAIKLRGDSLILFDSETFSKVAKMLRFKNKKRNLIDNMTVELLIQDSQLELFPFMFFMDRYKIGVMGHNDLALNLNYHISVLKSPIPFKFGLNITGNVEDMKFRLGGAKFKEERVAQLSKIVDTTRINLREQINIAFRRGAHAALNSTLSVKPPKNMSTDVVDTLTHADSLKLIEQGLIEKPESPLTPAQIKEKKRADKKAEKERKKNEKKKVKSNNKEMKKEDTILTEESQNNNK